MCHLCDSGNRELSAPIARRGVLKLAGGAALSLAVSGSHAAEAPKAPPKPENVLSPDAALDRLMKGNERYVEGIATAPRLQA